jgi:hypothetical protein
MIKAHSSTGPAWRNPTLGAMIIRRLAGRLQSPVCAQRTEVRGPRGRLKSAYPGGRRRWVGRIHPAPGARRLRLAPALGRGSTGRRSSVPRALHRRRHRRHAALERRPHTLSCPDAHVSRVSSRRAACEEQLRNTRKARKGDVAEITGTPTGSSQRREK